MLSLTKRLSRGGHPGLWTKQQGKPSVASSMMEKRVSRLNNREYKNIDRAKERDFTLDRPGMDAGIRHIKFGRSEAWNKYQNYEKFELQKQKKAMFVIRNFWSDIPAQIGQKFSPKTLVAYFSGKNIQCSRSVAGTKMTMNTANQRKEK